MLLNIYCFKSQVLILFTYLFIKKKRTKEMYLFNKLDLLTVISLN